MGQAEGSQGGGEEPTYMGTDMSSLAEHICMPRPPARDPVPPTAQPPPAIPANPRPATA